MLKLATCEALPEGYTGTVQWYVVYYVVNGLLPVLEWTFSDKTEYLRENVHNTVRYAIDRSKIKPPYLGMKTYTYYLLGYGITKTANIVIVEI